MNKDFIKNTAFSVSGFMVMILSNLVFNFSASRLLGADNYGVYSSFFALLMAFSQPINSLQLAAAKYSSSKKISLSQSILDITPTLILSGLVVFLMFLVSSPFLKYFFNLKSVFSVLIGGGVLIIWMLLAGFRGVYQGNMNFKIYGINIGVEALFRMAAGIIFIILGFQIQGAIGASIISGIIGVIILIEGKFKFVVHHLKLKNWKINNELRKEFVNACIVLLPFGLMVSLDLILTQRVIGGVQSGYLSACGLFGKSLISLSLVFGNIVFSYTLKNKDNTLWMGVLLTVVSFILPALVLIPTGEWLVRTLLGKEYLPVASILPLYVIASIPMGIMQNLVSYSIGKGIGSVKLLMWLFLAALSGVYLLCLIHYSLPVFFLWMLVSGLVLDGILFWVITRYANKVKITLDTINK